MTTLFELPPSEPKKRRQGPRRGGEEIHEAKAGNFLPSAASTPAIQPIGTLDDGVECADSTCRGTAHDILHEEHGEWLVQCCFCNTAQWVPVVKGHLKPKEAEFVFRDGRFSGLSIDEAVALPRGLDYVVWAAKDHKRPAVKAACETWLAKSRSER